MPIRRGLTEDVPNLSMINVDAEHSQLGHDGFTVKDVALQDQPTASVQRDTELKVTTGWQGPGCRLDSWKQIASHFSRDIRTVQRWERYEGLPVHRHIHKKGGSVYAFQHEVDAWWRNRSPRNTDAPPTRRVTAARRFLNGWGCELEQSWFPLTIDQGLPVATRDEAPVVPLQLLASRCSTSFGERTLSESRNDRCILSHGLGLQKEFEKDLTRAIDLQSTLLPTRGLRVVAWDTYYNYAPAGGVGGDYCDLVTADTGDLFFFFGDAVGKGIMGSMIASQLHALFRAVLSMGLPLNHMVECANRLFCESMATKYYATVVCGRASSDGAIEIINGGHPAPLILRSGQAIPVPATGVPVGLFPTSTYGAREIQLAPGEALLLYTDGITETRNPQDEEYGPERLSHFVAERSHLPAEELVRACADDVTTFASNARRSDDRTLMAIRHA